MILGKRIRLRGVEREDLPLFLSWLNDREVRRNLAGDWPFSMAQEERWFAQLPNRSLHEQPLVIEIPHEAGWLPIGNCSFHNLNWLDRNAELGLMIGVKAHWNQGYGTEAMQLMQAVGFETLNLHRLYLQVYERNLAGIRAYEKAGFVHEGRQRQGRYNEGMYLDVLIMSILRPEWDARNEGAQ